MPQLAGKRLELLKEIFPRLSRVAFLLYAKDQSHKIFAKEADAAARTLGLELRPVIVQSVAELEAAFASMQKDRMDAVIVQPLFVNTLGQGSRIVQLAIGHKLPTIGDSDVFADIGGLVMYGPDPLPMYQRVADYADRVLRGGKPADMPIEQPSRFELAVNLKTANALGVAIPKSVIVRADRVIE